jgi:hypothetical protein
MKMIEIEIVDYTNNRVYYFEDVCEGEEKLKELLSIYEAHEIGVSHFSVFGAEIPFSRDNIDFIKDNDAETLEALITFYEFEFGITPNVSLETVAERMEDDSISYFIANNEKDAFIEFYNEMGLFEKIPPILINYIDWEKLLRDYKLNGLGVYRLSYEHPTMYRYMFCH